MELATTQKGVGLSVLGWHWCSAAGGVSGSELSSATDTKAPYFFHSILNTTAEITATGDGIEGNAGV